MRYSIVTMKIIITNIDIIKLVIIIPLLPIYEMPLKKAGIKGLTQFVSDFIANHVTGKPRETTGQKAWSTDLRPPDGM